MNRDELHEYCWANVRKLDQQKVRLAATVIRDAVTDETKRDLTERMAEDRTGWLGGRQSAPCWFCEARGEALHGYEMETCPVCKGAKVAPELGMHFGFGMWVRNLLRQKGMGEKFLGIENLDDSYVPLIEIAMGYEDPYATA